MTYIDEIKTLSGRIRKERLLAEDKLEYWQTLRKESKGKPNYLKALNYLLQTSTPDTKQEIIIEIITSKFDGYLVK
jgi:hypothetical protein